MGTKGKHRGDSAVQDVQQLIALQDEEGAGRGEIEGLEQQELYPAREYRRRHLLTHSPTGQKKKKKKKKAVSPQGEGQDDLTSSARLRTSFIADEDRAALKPQHDAPNDGEVKALRTRLAETVALLEERSEGEAALRVAHEELEGRVAIERAASEEISEVLIELLQAKFTNASDSARAELGRLKEERHEIEGERKQLSEEVEEFGRRKTEALVQLEELRLATRNHASEVSAFDQWKSVKERQLEVERRRLEEALQEAEKEREKSPQNGTSTEQSGGANPSTGGGQRGGKEAVESRPSSPLSGDPLRTRGQKPAPLLQAAESPTRARFLPKQLEESALSLPPSPQSRRPASVLVGSASGLAEGTKMWAGPHTGSFRLAMPDLQKDPFAALPPVSSSPTSYFPDDDRGTKKRKREMATACARWSTAFTKDLEHQVGQVRKQALEALTQAGSAQAPSPSAFGSSSMRINASAPLQGDFGPEVAGLLDREWSLGGEIAFLADLRACPLEDAKFLQRSNESILNEVKEWWRTWRISIQQRWVGLMHSRKKNLEAICAAAREMCDE